MKAGDGGFQQRTTLGKAGESGLQRNGSALQQRMYGWQEER